MIPSITDWKAKGKEISVHGRSLFVIDEGNANETIVVLHGYPTCSYDYYAVLPILTQKYRVIVHDHLGFGLSDKPLDYSYSLLEQAELALGLWQKLGLQKVHLLAHDYGTSVATEIIARADQGYEPVKLDTITIGNGSMLIEMAKLQAAQKILRSKRWGPLLAKLSSQWVLNRSMKKLWYDQSKYNAQEIEVLWQMMSEHPDWRKTFPVVSRYLLERVKFWHRWIGRGLYQTQRHINILWADKDPVAIVQMGEKLHQNIPSNTYKTLPNIGHYPMLEEPEIYANAVLEMIDSSK
ncbi:MAG TPA: hypothetical protein DCS93_00255 [Microscillaceae bacterium]|nr:hypothetical protein [Microscillaceae bacterium]